MKSEEVKIDKLLSKLVDFYPIGFDSRRGLRALVAGGFPTASVRILSIMIKQSGDEKDILPF